MKTIEQQYMDGDVSLGFYVFEIGIAGDDFDHFLKRQYFVLQSEAWRHASSGYPDFKCFLPTYNQKLAELCIQALKQFTPCLVKVDKCKFDILKQFTPRLVKVDK